MVTKDEVSRQLHEMGRVDVVGPPREFVDLLAQRLEVMASVEYVPAVTAPRRARPRRMVFAPAFAALALVVAAIVLNVGGGSAAYALDDPFNVQVQFADGHVVDGTDGLKVPKGATVVVGGGGSVRIRDRVYTEGDVIRIGNDGRAVASRIEVAPAPTSTRVEPAPTTTETRVSTTPVTTVASPVREPEPTVAPRPAEPAPTTRVEVPVTTLAPETTRAPTTTRAVVSMELGAQRVEMTSQVSLSWSAVDGAAKYIVVRTVATAGATPAEPVYPPVAPTTVVVQTTLRTYTDTAESVEGVFITAARYRVVALDGSGKVIGSSRFVQINLPR